MYYDEAQFISLVLYFISNVCGTHDDVSSRESEMFLCSSLSSLNCRSRGFRKVPTNFVFSICTLPPSAKWNCVLKHFLLPFRELFVFRSLHLDATLGSNFSQDLGFSPPSEVRYLNPMTKKG